MAIVGTYKTNHAFSGVRTKLMMRDTVTDSAIKLQELVREEIARFSDTGELWKSVKRTGSRRVSSNARQETVYSNLEYAHAIEYGWATRWVKPTKKTAMKWFDAKSGTFFFSKGHFIGPFIGHHMFLKASSRFEREYAEDIAERNARIWLGAVSAGRRTTVI